MLRKWFTYLYVMFHNQEQKYEKEMLNTSIMNHVTTFDSFIKQILELKSEVLYFFPICTYIMYIIVLFFLCYDMFSSFSFVAH